MWFFDFSIIIIFLISSGFFSGIEIAFISADRLLVEVERQKGNKKGQILADFLEHPSQFLGTTLVGNNIVLVFLSILASDFLLTYVGIDSVTFVGTIKATLITTVIVLIFGEFLPKVSFQINPTEILFAFAYPLRVISLLLKPLALIMIKSSNAIIQVVFRIPAESTEKAFNRKDLDHFINNINSEDDEIDTDLFQKVLFMHEIKVRDCMIPRNEIEGIEINQSIEELQAMFIESRLSRLLVYRDNLDYIEGYVHHQSLFEPATSIKEMLWKIPMVHEFMPAQDVMNSLIKDKLNLAWVVDERGGTAGIIALEDILEEIFGEIADEHDLDEENLQINDHEFVFPGRSEIGVINEEFELDIPENEDYHTLSGLIVFNKDYIPEQKEIVILDNYKFIVEEVSSTRVEKVRVIKLKQEED